jgi:Nucleotidyl transferase AbiEii toxin, Type IV TA system
MPYKLHWNTVTPLLRSILNQLMSSKLFKSFRLVGGTSLSLQLGHRLSIDIDLFTDAPYGAIDFKELDVYLRNTFPYVSESGIELVGMGTSYFVGNNEEDAVKLDLYYTDSFIQSELIINGIRMASIEEIIAMKIDVVQRGGRKKDFWDLHELIGSYSFAEMVGLHALRYPYSHDAVLIKSNFTAFDNADEDFDPICLKGKYWELIKYEILQFVN